MEEDPSCLNPDQAKTQLDSITVVYAWSAGLSLSSGGAAGGAGSGGGPHH